MSFSTTARNLGLALGAAALLTPVEAQLYDKVIQTSLGPVQGYQYFTNQTELETYFGVSSSNVANFLGEYRRDTGTSMSCSHKSNE